MKTTQEKIEVMQAFLQGKQIEISQNGQDNWEKYRTKEPIWDWHKFDYKIEEEPQYIPFDFLDDLLGMKIKDEDSKYQITYQDSDGVGIYHSFIPYKGLLEEYTLIDGSPCGKLK